MKKWSAEIDLFNAKADKVRAEAKIEYLNSIETLQDKHAAARIKLQELMTARDDAWEDLKKGAENAWLDVKTAFNGAATRFK